MRLNSPSVRIFAFASAALLLGSGAVPAGDRVFQSPEDVEPLAAGAQVPSARVSSVRGASVDLADEVRDSGALLVFYRGGW